MNTGFFLAQAAQPGGAGGIANMMLPMILIFGLFYIMMIRPQQRKEKERQRMIQELRAGQKIMFAGGLIGTIIEARETSFLVEIAPKVNIEVARGSVSQVIKEGEATPAEERK